MCHVFKRFTVQGNYLASGPADLQERFALGALRL
jgi:hypothetical protein